jgi:hypothetical protein
MDSSGFDRFTRTLGDRGSRRAVLSGLCSLAALGLWGARFAPATEAGQRHHEKARRTATRHRDVQAQGKRKKKCAKAGQTPKRGKRCCRGLVDDGSGRCSAPGSVPPAPDGADGSNSCQSCGGATPICLGGTCVSCTADAQCAAAGLGARCCNGTCQACCEAADCPSPQCQTCQNGTCMAANQGQVCGTSATSGEHVRCCHGVCPDPICFPVGATGPSCSPGDSCSGVNCCSRHPATCVVDQCVCPESAAAEPCGSDADCAGNATAKACICGTCQAMG